MTASEGTEPAALPASMTPDQGNIDAISNYDEADDDAPAGYRGAACWPPVVPSVGAVPVEVPEEVKGRFLVRAEIALHRSACDADECPGHELAYRKLAEAALVALAEVFPLIAARVRAETIAELSPVDATEGAPDVAEMRRWANQTPDRYARDAVLAAADSVERMQRALARVRAEERQRCAELVERLATAQEMTHDECGTSDCVWCHCNGFHSEDCPWVLARAWLAAGTAEPAATSEPCCEHGKAAPHPIDPTMGQIFWHEHPLCPGPVAILESCGDPGSGIGCVNPNCTHDSPWVPASYGQPVATRTEPVDEVVCPNCEHAIRARMSDQPEAPTLTEPRTLRVMEAHKLEDCADPSTCWWSPNRTGERLHIHPEQDGQR